MAKPKRYRLLCPIARALDRLGDRWTLLILRDLHAGPARFGELIAGMPGLASNLLSARLEVMQDHGLVVRRPGSSGSMVYALTEEGEATAPVLFELARFGGRQPPDEDLKRPGNLRTVVVTLKEALRRVVAPDDDVDLELTIDDEHFAIRVKDGAVEVGYGPAPDTRTAVHTDYEAMVAVTDGRMPPAEFAANHVQVARGTEAQVLAFRGLVLEAFGA